MNRNILKRTKEQRQLEIKTIIKKLNELHLNTSYEGIKTLFNHMKEYIDINNINNVNEEPILINIPCADLELCVF